MTIRAPDLFPERPRRLPPLRSVFIGRPVRPPGTTASDGPVRGGEAIELVANDSIF